MKDPTPKMLGPITLPMLLKTILISVGVVVIPAALIQQVAEVLIGEEAVPAVVDCDQYPTLKETK